MRAISKYWDKRLRDKRIVELSSSMTIAELAVKFTVNKRTVQRALKDATHYVKEVNGDK